MSNGNPFIYPGGHWFVYTTGSSGALQNIYSWGSNGNPGYWENSRSTLAQNVHAAESFISNGNTGARAVGNSSLDPFVAFAYSQLSQQLPHLNGALPPAIGQPSCQGEAKNLVAYAQFLQSRYLFTDSNGVPVFSARAVSGFTADGRPIYAELTAWEAAGYADAASYAAARQEAALQYANAQAAPTWDPFYQSDFNSVNAGRTPGHADGEGGFYLSNGGR